MKYKIIPKSWSKRRKLDTPREVKTIEFIDFIKQHNHFCKMVVGYQDGSEETLISRVVHNEIKDHWTIDGMSVCVQLLD